MFLLRSLLLLKSHEYMSVLVVLYVLVLLNAANTHFIYIYIYIYIYIVIHRQTVSFYQNSSVWLDTQTARSRDRNPSNFTLDFNSDHSSTKRTTLAKGISRYFLFLETAAAAFFTFFIPYLLLECSILSKSFALC